MSKSKSANIQYIQVNDIIFPYLNNTTQILGGYLHPDSSAAESIRVKLPDTSAVCSTL